MITPLWDILHQTTLWYILFHIYGAVCFKHCGYRMPAAVHLGQGTRLFAAARVEPGRPLGRALEVITVAHPSVVTEVSTPRRAITERATLRQVLSGGSHMT
jgi:hypothetical protein